MDSARGMPQVDIGVCERRFKSQGEKLTDIMSMCVGLKSGDDHEKNLVTVALNPMQT
jgi:hypothetical protein